MVATVIIVIFPLCMLPNIGALDKTSFLAVASITFFSGIVIVRGVEHLVHGVTWKEVTPMDVSFFFFFFHFF